MLLVYIAGPLTKGDRIENIRKAVLTAARVRDRGHLPFVPHIYDLWDLIDHHHYEYWMEMDLDWVRVSNIVLRLEGESSGADREVALAKELGIPVFLGLQEFMESKMWVPQEEKKQNRSGMFDVEEEYLRQEAEHLRKREERE